MIMNEDDLRGAENEFGADADRTPNATNGAEKWVKFST